MILTKAILTAMPEEAELIIQKYKLQKKGENVPKMLTQYEGERVSEDGEKEHIILIVCGVGKIYASMATTYLLDNFDPFKIINIGVVGNLNHELLQIGDVIIPNTFLQHDIFIPEEIDSLSYLRAPIFTEYAIGEEYDLEKFSLHLSGICITGDQFINSKEKQLELHENFGADIVDMESYAIASIAQAYGTLDKLVVIKSVSDGANDTGTQDHIKNLEIAMKNALIILDFVL